LASDAIVDLSAVSRAGRRLLRFELGEIFGLLAKLPGERSDDRHERNDDAGDGQSHAQRTFRPWRGRRRRGRSLEFARRDSASGGDGRIGRLAPIRISVLGKRAPGQLCARDRTRRGRLGARPRRLRLLRGAVGFDSLDRFFERAAFGGDVVFGDRRLDAAQLVEQGLAGAFVHRLARVRRGLRQSGHRPRDQRMVVCHVSL
jgi:hypothetical protein